MKDHPSEGYLSIGQILKPQGLKGQVKIRPDTDDPGRFSALDKVYVTGGKGEMQALRIGGISVRGQFVFATLGEDSTIEAAEKRRDLMLYLPRSEAVPLGEHENFIADLIGCALVDSDGRHIGTITDVLQPGANDVYVVQTDQGSMLVPALRHVITSVDIAAKKVVAQAQRLAEVSVLED